MAPRLQPHTRQYNWTEAAERQTYRGTQLKAGFQHQTADKMDDGYNPDEPNARKFCEVIQIGIEDDTAEVTIFYTPERGLSL